MLANPALSHRLALRLRGAGARAALSKSPLSVGQGPPVLPAGVELIGRWKVHGGHWMRFAHPSTSTKTRMTFSVFEPPGASAGRPAPCLFYLSGLTCTDENAVQKAGGFAKAAAAHGLALVCPDTSPRGAGVPGEDASWDFGTGAGFYVDATKEPWAGGGYRMESYVTKELRQLIGQVAPALDASRAAITGHSMGGHGALTLALKDPAAWASCSAFAPICHPTACPWGVKAFEGYLAGGVEEGRAHDAVLLLRRVHEEATRRPHNVQAKARLAAVLALPLLVDQGSADGFLPPSDANGSRGQLHPLALAAALAAVGHVNQFHVEGCVGNCSSVRLQEGYDHSYHFITTFIEEHVAWHARHLAACVL